MLPELFYTPTNRDLLKLTGKDRQSFLQGMVTNDVLRLQPGEGCYAFMLDATAHILADMRVLNVGDYLLLDLEPGMAPFVAETLDKYLIMEKCRITDVTADYETFAVGGVEAPERLPSFGDGVNAEYWRRPEGSVITTSLYGEVSVVASGSIRGLPRLQFYVPANESTASEYMRGWKEAGAKEVFEATLDALRIEAGIPRFGVDMDKSVLAPEVRQDARAVSYKKGCYIGQEIVARIDARGHTNKGLVGFFLDPAQAALPEHDAPVFVGGDPKPVGRITSAAISPTLGVPVALGYLRNEHAAPGTSLTVGSPDGATVQIATLPFVESEKR